MTMGNVIVGTIVLLIIAAAAYGVWHSRKKGGCSGCCGCCSESDKDTQCRNK